MMKKAGGWCGIALVSLFAVGMWLLPVTVSAGPGARRANQAQSLKPVDKPEAKAGLAQAGIVATDKEVLSVPTFVQNRAGFLTAVIDIAPYDSWDAYADTSNTVLAIDIAAAVGFPSGTSVTMTGIGWDVIINTVAPGMGSYRSEARSYFDDNIAPDGTGLHLAPGIADASVGVGTYSSGGILDLTDNSIPDIVLPNGVLRLEFYESYDDAGDAIDGNYDAPSTFTIQVLDPTATGACCVDSTGVCAGTMTQASCSSVSGRTWFTGEDCATYTCPAPVFGNTCANPIVVGSLPYSDPGRTNCGLGNDYSSTCLGSYDGGEDIIYQLDLASNTCINMTMNSNATWVGMAIHNTCPLHATTCIAKATSSGANVAINSLSLAAGTYYIMIDTWPSPNCIPSFTLNISQCPTGGACCHSDGTCTDVSGAGACVGAGDIYKGDGTACLTSACPPGNDQCANADNISAVPFVDTGVSMPGATDDGNVNPSCDSSSSCGTGPANNGVWYTYTPTQDCRATIDQTGIDAATSIWTGADCTSLTQSTCSDPDPFTFLMTAGVQYWILVSNWSCSSQPTSNITFNFDCQPPPPPPVNDKCPGTKISCGETLNGTIVEAINDYDDTGICTGFNQVGRDVAYELELLADSTVTVSLDGVSGWDPAIYLISDCSMPTACLAGADVGFTGDPESFTVTLAAGTYYIIVDTFSSTNVGGPFTLSVACVALPVGACCTGGGCIEDTSLGCADVGGVFAGDNTNCAGSGAGGGGDCNANGLIDRCDLVNGAADCQPNGIPDACEVPPIGSGADCQGDGIPDECQLAGNKVIVLSEGFESGVPPTGWTAVVNNAYTWMTDTYAPYEGAQNATCLYDETYSGTQDEWIISPQLNMSGPVTLAGYSNGSIYWGITPYENYDIEAWIVIGPNVNDADDILLGQIDEETWTVTWEWAPFTYNFTAPATPFRIGFRYYGFDGAQAGLDAITVDGNAGPLPNDCNENQVPDECDAPVCGNNCLEGGVGSTAEECDGTEDAACPGECYPAGGPNACRCPFCGDGVVNPGEDCDGGACCTPNCTFTASSEVCRPAAGICDAVESCTGASSDCPADGFLSSVCRPSTGSCDPAEVCTGTGPNCPPEVVIAACIHGDGCCPGSQCNTNIDDDCPPVCGNNVTEPGEQCDGTDDGGCFYGLGCLADCTCEDRIPTVSTWGLVVLTLLLLTGAKLYFSRRMENAAN